MQMMSVVLQMYSNDVRDRTFNGIPEFRPKISTTVLDIYWHSDI